MTCCECANARIMVMYMCEPFVFNLIMFDVIYRVVICAKFIRDLKIDVPDVLDRWHVDDLSERKIFA